MASDAALDELLSQPTPAVVDAMRALEGDILVLGAGGKMGPSLATLALRASQEAGIPRRIYAAARFSDTAVEARLRAAGVETLAGDLLEPSCIAELPDVPNLVYMVGQKFGTTGEEARTWAINAWLPGAIAVRFPRQRMVAFSTGNVYPLCHIWGDGPSEADPPGPIGEYAQSALGRERVLAFFSMRLRSPMAILRLNYAVEPRYGVLRDLADRIMEGRPVDLTTGRVNLIWQRDANAIALMALAHCAVPPLVLNVTGRPAHSVRWLAEELGKRLGRTPVFEGMQADTALLSNAAACEQMFGTPPVGAAEMLDRVAEWVREGGRSLGKPTHFEVRDGAF